jgi:CheY-like chemotaxis protein
MAKIMLVEDDNNLREIYEARLLAEGYEIVSAADGEAALAVAVKEKPDLIIADVMMPKISGFDMLDILRTTPETKDVKVIMMTALSQAEDKGRADKLGADRYLVKSQVTLEDVAKVAREVLGGETAAAAPGATPAPADPAAPATPTAVPAADPAPMPAPAVPAAAPPAMTPAPTNVVLDSAAPAATPDPAPAPEPSSAPGLMGTSTLPPEPAPAPAPAATPIPVTTTVNEPAPEDPVEGEAATHGKTLEPISDIGSEDKPEPVPAPAAAEPAPADSTDKPETPPQPGNVIQPGPDPSQIAL